MQCRGRALIRPSLCELAHRFPSRVAKLLERDRRLTRNFREETVTDLLMASMIGLEDFGIAVDFPDEPTTGGDMEWIFAAPMEVGGGRYLRFILQAKRAQYQKLKAGGYWFYQHLDHGSPKGSQARTLVAHARRSGKGGATLPLYIFYHPSPALKVAAPGQPAIEGVNLAFADQVAAVVGSGCAREKKKVEFWRKGFLSLSDVLCWPAIVTGLRHEEPSAARFMMRSGRGFSLAISGTFHPDLMARRMQYFLRRASASSLPPLDGVSLEPAQDISGEIRRAIERRVTPRICGSLRGLASSFRRA